MKECGVPHSSILLTLREGERVFRSPHPPLPRSPFPEKTEWRVESGDKKRPIIEADFQLSDACVI